MESQKKSIKPDTFDLEKLIASPGGGDIVANMLIHDVDYEDIATMEQTSSIIRNFIQSKNIWKLYYVYHYPEKYYFLAPKGVMLDKYKKRLDIMSENPGRDFTYWKRMLEYDETFEISSHLFSRNYLVYGDNYKVYKVKEGRKVYYVIMSEFMEHYKIDFDVDLDELLFTHNIISLTAEMFESNHINPENMQEIAYKKSIDLNPFFTIYFEYFQHSADNFYHPFTTFIPDTVTGNYYSVQMKISPNHPVSYNKLLSDKIKCNTCAVPTKNKCCDKGFYCSVSCQVADWKIHKKIHK